MKPLRVVLARRLCAWLSIVSSTAALAAQASAPDQRSAPSWIGQAYRFEAHLRDARVISLEDIGTGVTNPKRAHLDPPTPFESLVFKVIPPKRYSGYWDSYRSEIAAYELDKLLSLDMVPPAIEREIDGETGAAVMWVDAVKSVKQLGGTPPSGPAWDKPIRKMIMFDALIANPDRNAGNILVGAPGEIVLIDHSRAFVTDRKPKRQPQRVDAELWDRMLALKRADVDSKLGPWIGRRAVDAMMDRLDEMKKDVDRLIAQRGRDAVIIP